MIGRILVIAGSDSGGGAGIQADIKTAMALGAYATTAVTALTAQNTQGVGAVLPTPPAFLRQQIVAVLDDIGADAVKTGMLVDAATIAVVVDTLGPRVHAGSLRHVVLDPVMIAKGGARLLAGDAMNSYIRLLLPMATLLTPNVPEAEQLAGMEIPDLAAMHHAADALLTLGVPAVLLKGGHMPGAVVTDLLATADGTVVFERPRLATPHTHGTGCTLSTAIAAGLAQGMALTAAVERARSYVQAAIAGAPGLGTGHGPLNHAVRAEH
jgi:hydroxymethylpyrimidine/phosphomethylpyrimidine kinase